MDTQQFMNLFWTLFALIVAVFVLGVTYHIGWLRGWSAKKKQVWMKMYGGQSHGRTTTH